VAITVAIPPTTTDVADALTERPVTVAPTAVTVTTAESLWAPRLAVIVVVPPACAVTTPVAPILATEALLDVHVAVAVALVPSL
jgi:glycine/serine hydroxymethyltransferase